MILYINTEKKQEVWELLHCFFLPEIEFLK